MSSYITTFLSSIHNFFLVTLRLFVYINKSINLLQKIFYLPQIQSIQFYLYSPYSQITICLRALTNVVTSDKELRFKSFPFVCWLFSWLFCQQENTKSIENKHRLFQNIETGFYKGAVGSRLEKRYMNTNPFTIYLHEGLHCVPVLLRTF